MSFTSGYELGTALTNVLIFIVSFYGFIKIKKDKLWKFFFALMSIDSFIGAIVHGISMSINLNVLLWLILIVFFVITVNTFLAIFLKLKVRNIIILSLILLTIMLTLFYYGMNFLLIFDFYVLLAMIINTYSIFKYNIKNKDYFLLGIVIQLIGGIILLTDFKEGYLDHNGVYHIFMAITMIMFYIGVKKNTSN